MPLTPSLRRASVARAAALTAMVVFSFAAPDASAATSTSSFGVYRGGGNVAGVTEFEAWVGTKVTWALDFVPGATWADIESPTWAANRWARSKYRTIYSVPLLPASGGSLREGAAGAYNEHFRRLAQTLVATGEGDAVLRLGWEFNGAWFRWSAAHEPAAFASYWRQIVTTMRGVPGAAFRFDWCPILGNGAVAAERAYPGDAYVDYIGLDVYDHDWYPGWQEP
ncbi:MAG TPA: glycosyl hydrolase, partial [Gaiellaceae bacterium]|nr:glycosyl hydrolase [Gaiellaceae bacterium]